MKVTVKWCYPDDRSKQYVHVYYDVAPETIRFTEDFLYFGTKEDRNAWKFPISHVLDFCVIGDDEEEPYKMF